MGEINNTIGWGEGATNNTIGWGQAQEVWCDSSPTPSAQVGATLMKTGQTTSYRTGDDGDIEAGRDVDFFTLASNNPFGSTARFTDELGGSTYANNIVIDWSTYNGSNVLGFRRTTNGTPINWNNSIDGALSVSVGTFTSGWRLPNHRELLNIADYSIKTSCLNYSPFLITSSVLWSSNTPANSTTTAFALIAGPNNVSTVATKTVTTATGFNCYYIPVRTFTVTGTTLT